MSPYERIKQLYDDKPEQDSFDHYVAMHMRTGFVFSTPEFFIMGTPRIKDSLQGDCHDASQPPDTWFIFAMAGDTSKAWSILPYELPYIAWERDRPHGKELHIYPTARIRAMCNPAKA
jgi:hypothetical protein